MYLIDPISRALFAAFPWLRSLGKYNRRYISGTTTWSQHAWANAEDVADPLDSYDSARLDIVAAWLRRHRDLGTDFGGGAKVGTVLWKVPAHHDHIHYERDPKQRGTPPPSAPTIDDPLGDMNMLCAKGDKGPHVKAAQLRILLTHPNALPQWGADSDFGDETVAGTKTLQATLGVPQTGAWDAATFVAAYAIPGAAGPKGPKGDKGATGAKGADGAPGPKGDKGDRGAQGIAGVDGRDGKPGTLTIKGDVTLP